MTEKRVPQERADERVWELLYYRSQNQITPERFVELVNIIDMRPSVFDPDGDDGYIQGTFDIVRVGYCDNVITLAEYEAIAQERPLS